MCRDHMENTAREFSRTGANTTLAPGFKTDTFCRVLSLEASVGPLVHVPRASSTQS